MKLLCVLSLFLCAFAQGNTRFFAIKRDFRRCAAPMCGGYWLTSVGTDPVSCDGGVHDDNGCYVYDAFNTDGSRFQDDVGGVFDSNLIVHGYVSRNLTSRFPKLVVVNTWLHNGGSVFTFPIEANATGSLWYARRVAEPCTDCPSHEVFMLNAPLNESLGHTSHAKFDDVQFFPASSFSPDVIRTIFETESRTGIVAYGSISGHVLRATAVWLPSRNLSSLCGAVGLVECDAGHYCARDAGVCPSFDGVTDTIGKCAEKPALCTADYAPVCGCDRVTYPNRCAAAAAGMSVASDGECSEGPVHPPHPSAVQLWTLIEVDGKIVARAIGGQAQCGDQVPRSNCDVEGVFYAGLALSNESLVALKKKIAAQSRLSLDIVFAGSFEASHVTGTGSSLFYPASAWVRGNGALDVQFDSKNIYVAHVVRTSVMCIRAPCPPIWTLKCITGKCPEISTSTFSMPEDVDAAAEKAGKAGVLIAGVGDKISIWWTAVLPSDESPVLCGVAGTLECGEGYFCNTNMCPSNSTTSVVTAPGVCEMVPSVCTFEYMPVCGCDGNTYPNRCAAFQARQSIASFSSCENTAKPSLGQACGVRGSILQCDEGEFCSFEVAAQCGAADVPGVCKPQGDICPLMFKPVCGCDRKTYPNACAAAAAGQSVFLERPCALPDLGTVQQFQLWAVQHKVASIVSKLEHCTTNCNASKCITGRLYECGACLSCSSNARQDGAASASAFSITCTGSNADACFSQAVCDGVARQGDACVKDGVEFPCPACNEGPTASNTVIPIVVASAFAVALVGLVGFFVAYRMKKQRMEDTGPSFQDTPLPPTTPGEKLLAGAL